MPEIDFSLVAELTTGKTSHSKCFSKQTSMMTFPWRKA